MVPKIANQQKLAKIYIAKNAAPEVKASARKGINDAAAFEWMYLNTRDAAIRSEALDNMKLDDAGFMKLAFRLAGSDKDGARELAARVKDNAKLSEAVVAYAKEAKKKYDEICRGTYVNNPSQYNADVDKYNELYNVVAVFAPLARDMRSVGPFCNSYDIAQSKGKECDLYTPFEEGMRAAFVESLTDDERAAALSAGTFSKSMDNNPVNTLLVSGKSGPGRKFSDPAAAAMARQYMDPSVVEMSKEEVLAGFKNKLLAEDVALFGSKDGFRALDADAQLAKVQTLKDPEFRKKVVFETIDSYKAFERLKDGHFKMLETIPVEDLAAQLRWAAKEMQGNVQQFRLSGPASAKAIKDQAVIKDLLLDNDAWVHQMGLDEDFGKAYSALLDNITDENLLEEVFRKGKPDEHDRIASKWTIRNVFKRLSPARLEKLRAEVRACADEQAKKNVVVKGYYLGMSLADFCVVNDENGMPATAKVDGGEKVTSICFSNEQRDKFLDVGKGMTGIGKFAALYCSVPDGIDLSENDRTELVPVVRSIKHIKVDGNKYDRYYWEYAHYSKYVDTVHKFQAEIKEESGELTIRYPVDEGIIGTIDMTKEEENELLSAF